MMVRRQAVVERVSDYLKDYQDYFMCDHVSVEDYIHQMSRNSHWPDNAIIRDTVDSLKIQIHVISAINKYIQTFNMSCGVYYTEEQHFRTKDVESQKKLFQKEQKLIVASNFIMLYGDGRKLSDYPAKFSCHVMEEKTPT